jgi:glycosyltransferase involved in cell wall biosynthesis
VIILHTEASTGWGGQEIRILREAIGMRERGHKVIIAAHPESGLLLNSEKNNFRTGSVEFKRRNFPRIVFFFKNLIEKENVDIVNTHSSKDSWLALPSARIAGNKPLVLRTRHLSTEIHGGILNKFLYDMLPHFIITTGEAIRKQMIDVNGFDGNKILSIPTGVDTGIFDPEPAHSDIRGELNLEPLTPLIGAVSVIRSWKGLDYLVKAVPRVLKEMPQARFVIAGDGIHKKTLENTIEETGVGNKIYLLGHREDIVNILSSIDVLVHPSYANEGVPQTILQAMAMKKPVIASDLSPLKEVVIDGETGTLVPVKDPEAIAEGIIRLLRDKEMSGKFGENGRKLIVSSYSVTGMLDKLEALYSRAKT